MQIRGRQVRPLWLVAAGAVVVALLVGVGFWVGLPAVPVLGQSLSIGYVDMQKALEGHPRRSASERALQEFFQAKQREFQQRSRGLDAVQRQELDRQMQQQFVQKREDLLGGLDKDIRGAVEQVAKDRGITVVLDRTVVLYGGTDLTDAVVAKLAGK
ncbi:MAG TPA: OmpH family outer membrane protein [bacterium]|nr:OmpH family outer membrane protein [bacterium]